MWNVHWRKHLRFLIYSADATRPLASQLALLRYYTTFTYDCYFYHFFRGTTTNNLKPYIDTQYVSYLLSGLVLHPRLLYSQTVENAFHLTQAALDSSFQITDVPVSLYIRYDLNNGKPPVDFLLCKLGPEHTYAPLDIKFSVNEKIVFYSIGKFKTNEIFTRLLKTPFTFTGGVIHLSGYTFDEKRDSRTNERSSYYESRSGERSKNFRSENESNNSKRDDNRNKSNGENADEDADSDYQLVEEPPTKEAIETHQEMVNDESKRDGKHKERNDQENDNAEDQTTKTMETDQEMNYDNSEKGDLHQESGHQHYDNNGDGEFSQKATGGTSPRS